MADKHACEARKTNLNYGIELPSWPVTVRIVLQYPVVRFRKKYYSQIGSQTLT